MPFNVCIPIPEIPDPRSIPLPGGIEIEHLNLAEVIQPALTPLVPLFNIIDTVVALFNCFKAIPDMLGPPPDPTALTSCLPELGEKIAKLLALVPQMSIPMTVIALLDLVLDTLGQARRMLVHLQQQRTQLLNLVDRATDLDDAGLSAILVCKQGHIEQEAANVGKSLAAMGKLIGLINLFMGLIGGPEIPDLSDLAGQPLDTILDPLDQLVETLQAARDLVPLP